MALTDHARRRLLAIIWIVVALLSLALICWPEWKRSDPSPQPPAPSEELPPPVPEPGD
jgi:hypothetical protein